MIRMVATTDNRHIGAAIDYDPAIGGDWFPLPDGTGFKPTALVEIEPGHWSIRCPNYTVIAREV